MKLDQQLIDLFCEQFGEELRSGASAETDMDDVESWDSLSYIDFVMAIEDAYGLEFTETESAQMFQLGHVQRIVNAAKEEIPHDDVLHAYCQLKSICDAPRERRKIVLLSGSSTREGLLDLKSCVEIARNLGGDSVDFYNLSVSGLVVAETLQLTEALVHVDNLHLVVGYSPIIFAGCGRAEFERAIERQRFRMRASSMESILQEEGYGDFEPMPALDIGQWAGRYLKGIEIDDLKYNPYVYPTLEPWDEEKQGDQEAILRYYNQAPLNFEESIRINTRLFDSLASVCRENGVPLSMLELTLHSKTMGLLEELGDIVTRSREFLEGFTQMNSTRYFESVGQSRITDNDFRDPGHIYRSKDKYTQAFLEEAVDWMESASQ